MSLASAVVNIRGDLRELKSSLDKAYKMLEGVDAKATQSNSRMEAAFKKTAGAVDILTKSAIAFTAIQMGKNLLDAGIAAEKMTVGLKSAIGSIEQARMAEKFLREESERLGLVFQDQIKSYVSLAAASKGTTLEGEQTRKIFTAVAEASTALQLSSEETTGAINAIQQMMSKGKVQAEELRGQLGERLPGAFNLAAEAMGVTTEQLNKMLEDGKVMADDFLPKFADALRNHYSGAAIDAADKTQAAVNRMSTAWFEFKRLLIDDLLPAITTAIVAMTNLLKWPANISQAYKLASAGLIEFTDVAMSNAEELQSLISGYSETEIRVAALKTEIEDLKKKTSGPLFSATLKQELAQKQAELKKLEDGVVSAGNTMRNWAQDAAAMEKAANTVKQSFPPLTKQTTDYEGVVWKSIKTHSSGAKKADEYAEKLLKIAAAAAKAREEMMGYDAADFWLVKANDSYEVMSRTYDYAIEREKEYVEEGKALGEDMWLTKEKEAKEATDRQYEYEAKEAEKANQAELKRQEALYESILSMSTSMWNQILDGQIRNWKDFGQWLLDYFKRLVAQMLAYWTANAVFKLVLGVDLGSITSLAGSAISGASSGGDASSGVLSLGSAISTLGTAAKTAYGWVAGLGAATTEAAAGTGAMAGAADAAGLAAAEAAAGYSAAANIVATETAMMEGSAASYGAAAAEAGAATSGAAASAMGAVGVLAALIMNWDRITQWMRGDSPSEYGMAAAVTRGVEAGFSQVDYFGNKIDLTVFSPEELQAFRDMIVKPFGEIMSGFNVGANVLSMMPSELAQSVASLGDFPTTLSNAFAAGLITYEDFAFAMFQTQSDMSEAATSDIERLISILSSIVIPVDAPESITMHLDTSNIEGKAAGGAVASGKPYWVGEQGPELVWFNQPAYVMNSAASMRYAAAGGKIWGGYADGTVLVDPASTTPTGTTELEMWEALYDITKEQLDLLGDLESAMQAVNDAYAEQIETAQALLDQGKITQEEFDQILAMETAAMQQALVDWAKDTTAEMLTYFEAFDSDVVDGLKGIHEAFSQIVLDLEYLATQGYDTSKAIQTVQLIGIIAAIDEVFDAIKSNLDDLRSMAAGFDSLYSQINSAIGLNAYQSSAADLILWRSVNGFGASNVSDPNFYSNTVLNLTGMTEDQLSEYSSLVQSYLSATISYMESIADFYSANSDQLSSVADDFRSVFSETTWKDLTPPEALDAALISAGDDLDATQEALDEYYQSLSDWLAYTSGIYNDFGSLLDQINSDIAGNKFTAATAGMSGAEKSAYITTLGISKYEQLLANLQAYPNADPAEGLRLAQEVYDLTQQRYDLEIASIEEIQGIIDSIDEKVRSLTYSSLNVALPTAKAASAGQDYATLLAAAQGGGTGAINAYLGFVDTYLEQQQAKDKSSAAYQATFAKVMADLAGIRGIQTAQKTTEELQTETNDILTNLAGIIEDYQDNLKGTMDDIASGADYYSDLYRQKADQTIAEIQGLRWAVAAAQAAFVQAQQDTYSLIERDLLPLLKSNGYSVADGGFWGAAYGAQSAARLWDIAKVLQAPGYATGGYLSANTTAWVGERGPELVRFGAGATVYPNGTMPAGGDSDTKQMLAAILASLERGKRVELRLDSGRTLTGEMRAVADSVYQSRRDTGTDRRQYR